MRWRVWFDGGTFVDVIRTVHEKEVWVEFYEAVRIECLGWYG